MTAAPSRPRRAGWLRWLLVAVLVLPLLEIVVLVAVGRSIGVWWTLGLLIVMAVAGAWLSRRETGRTFRALQRAVESGRMPTDEATDAILVTAGGLLLLLPGFLSDIVGLLLILPFTRPVARRLLQAVVAQQALRLHSAAGVGGGPTGQRRPGRGDVIEGEIIADHPAPGTWQGPDVPPPLGR